MTLASRVLDYLWSVAPKGATNSEIRQQLGITSHQTVYMATQQLVRQRLISAERQDHERTFHAVEDLGDAESPHPAHLPGISTGTVKLSPHGFEALARRVLSTHFGVPLAPDSADSVRKLFDLVSPDRQIIGDAKYCTLVRGSASPPAKFSVIAEHFRLIEETGAPTTFLVFGDDRSVPERWLERYGNLVGQVASCFLGDDGSLARLN